MIANFWCENCNCGAIGKEKDFHIAVDKEIKKAELKYFICSHSVTTNNKNNVVLKLLGYKTASAVIDKTKHANGRTPQEKEKRRVDDFKKNTLPTLNNREKAFFNKKFKSKGL